MDKPVDKVVKLNEPLEKDFLLDFYISCREELTRFGTLFDRTEETAEDLFSECHEKICRKYAIDKRVDYLKLMKTSMRNQFNDHFRRNVWLDENPYPESISPKPLPDLEETVCRREEHMILHLALELMSVSDQEILQEDLKPPQIKSWVKYQALKRLEKKVIEVMAERQTKNQSQESQEKGRDE